MDYIAELVIRALILGGAAMVIAYLSDEAGILHVAAAGLMGVGAYCSALLVIEGHSPITLSLAATIPAGGLCGLLLYVLTRRLTASYLAMALLSVTVVLHGLMMNWVSATGGPMGLANIPALPLAPGVRAAVLGGGVILLGVGLDRLRFSTFGARVCAVRDDEVLSRDLRLRPDMIRLILLVGSSCVLTLLGGIYAHHLRYIDPSSFTLTESMAVLAMAFLVPMHSVMRGLLGAVVFVMFPEVLRLIGLPEAVAAQLRQMLFGAMLLVMVTRPQRGAITVMPRRSANATSD